MSILLVFGIAVDVRALLSLEAVCGPMHTGLQTSAHQAAAFPSVSPAVRLHLHFMGIVS